MRAKAPGHRPAPPLAAVGMLCGEGRARHAILHLTARLTRLDPAAVDPLLDLEDHLLPFAVLHLGDHLRFRAVVEAERSPTQGDDALRLSRLADDDRSRHLAAVGGPHLEAVPLRRSGGRNVAVPKL